MERKWRKLETASITFISPSKMQIGDTWEGEFRGTSKDQTYGNMKHELQTKAGKLIINGSGRLDSLMSVVQPGMYIRLNYLGKKKIENGARAGTDAHDFELFMDENHTILEATANTIEVPF